MMKTAIAIGSLLVGTAAIADETKDMHGERALQEVYFDFDSDLPKGDLLMAANQLECTPNETIVLDAYADPVGSEEYNADLARRRAEAVRDRLVSYGIDRDRILLGVFGEQGTHRDEHAFDRRVEIRTSDEPVAALVERRDTTAIAVINAEGETEQVATP